LKESLTKFYLHEQYFEELKNLPWNLELDKWEKRGVRFLNIRKGISRHTVKFLRSKYTSFAIKQIDEDTAAIEVTNYKKLLLLGIHTLIPAGYVESFTHNGVKLAFIVTILEEKALPDSFLYRLNFKEENIKIIWDAIAELLAALHFNNIFWGDASLANALVRFFKVKDEKGRVKTELKAILADTETIEWLSKISSKKRAEDLRYFFDSMHWLNEDYKKAGYSRGNFATSKDKKYILQKYKEIYKRLRKIDAFEKETGINVRKHFHNVSNIFALESIKKQIDEHKWYLNEKAEKRIDIKEAASAWLKDVYYPIINEFEKLDILEYFPFKNSVGLYVDIMTHKYYLSREAGKDIGVEKAIKSYFIKYAIDVPLFSKVKSIFKHIKKLFY